MDLKTIDAVLKAIQSYMKLDTTGFEHIAQKFLDIQGQKTFDLRTQNGFRTLIDLKADVATLSAFLLFSFPKAERALMKVDDDVMQLLRGIEKLSSLAKFQAMQPFQEVESVRKMFLAMAKDLRVILILISWRYSDLLEIDRCSPKMRRKIARETLEVFVPIAGRLGIYTLKRKLEDHCFALLSPTDYKSMLASFQSRDELSEKTVQYLVHSLETFLHEKGVKAKVSGRVKGLYSSYVKLKRKGGGGLDQIYDLLAMRVIVPEQIDCYTVLGLVNNHWVSVIGRFKDYIAMPKINGYRSLHTTLVNMIPGSPRPVEIQIRTEEMHREAEYGIAAHWWYEEEAIKKGKTASSSIHQKNYQDKMKWVQNLVDLHETMKEETELAGFDFFSDRIFVMTLNGIVIELPKGSSPLDFAYAISEQLGHHCAKAKVNGKVVPLDYELRNGDKVFIVKKLEVSPNLYWLSLVKTEKARSAIQKWLIDQGSETLLNEGKRLVNRALRRFSMPKLDEQLSLFESHQGKSLSFQERKNLVASIAQGQLDVEEALQSVITEQRLRQAETPEQSTTEKGKIYVAGEPGLQTKVASCCSPTSRHKIVGYVTRGGFISIHRKVCKVLQSLNKERQIDAWWSGQMRVSRDRKIVRIEAVAQLANVLTPMSAILREREVSLVGFFHREQDHGHLLTFDLKLSELPDLQQIINSWQDVDGVLSVRVAQTAN